MAVSEHRRLRRRQHQGHCMLQYRQEQSEQNQPLQYKSMSGTR